MDLGGGGNGGIGGMMTSDERKGGGSRLDFTSNGQTGGFHNSTHADGGAMKFRTPDGRLVEIRNVWADNLEREMGMIRELVERYPFVAMDTEFPGVVARPVGDFNQPDYQYQTLRCNVDMLKIIQLGLSFANEHGDIPDNGCCTWQFNFSFNLSEDMYAHDSIQLLKNSGIDFEAHERRGIDLQHFGELLMTSGLVLMPNVTWLSFHSGYDFGYLLKLLTCDNLPQQETEFFDLLQLYFPKIYDIKFLVSSQNGFHGGLNKLAEELKVERIGPIHQAGSDSLLTEQVFLKVSDVFFNGVANLDKGKFRGKFSGQLYGYGGNQTGIFRSANKTPGHHNNGGLVGSAPGGGGNGTNSTASATTGNNNGSSNGNGINSHNNSNSSSVTVAGLQASATNAAAAAAAAAGGLSAGLSDANSSTSSAATVAIMVAGAAVAAANAANAAANAVSVAVAAEASESGSVAAPAAPNAEGTASVSSAPGGAPVDTGATVSMTTAFPGAGEPGNATTRSSNLAFSGTGGNVANSSGDPIPGQGDSAAGVPSAAGSGGGDGPPGILRNGAVTSSS